MRTYERSGITVDQCAECRGIFLDRGELERLVDAEAAFNAPAAPQPSQPRYEEKMTRTTTATSNTGARRSRSSKNSSTERPRS
jgi:Zn-finger nucleic acid-binding protein